MDKSIITLKPHKPCPECNIGTLKTHPPLHPTDDSKHLSCTTCGALFKKYLTSQPWQILRGDSDGAWYWENYKEKNQCA